MRKFTIIFIISFILYGICKLTILDELFINILIVFITNIKNTAIYIGLIEFINNKENSWEILTASLTTLIAIISLLFLYSRIRKQEKLLKETIASNASNRFRDAISMLESKNDAVVTGSIYLLDKLAREQPKKYAQLVRDLLCGYLRNETIKRKKGEKSFPDKYQTALNCLFRKGKIFKDFVYTDIDTEADLSKSNLSFADLSNADLSGVNFHNANLQYVNLYKANLATTKFYKAKLNGANLDKSFLMLTNFFETDLKKTLNLEKSSRLDSAKFGDSTPRYITEILNKIENEKIENKIRDKINNYLKKIVSKFSR